MKTTGLFPRALCLCLALAALARPAVAAWPERPVRIVLGLQAGSTIDIVGRLLASHLQERFRQGVIVENRAGASGYGAARHVASSPPDGYTLMLGGSLAAFETTLKEAAGITDEFTYISQVRRSPSYFGVSTKRGFKSLRELIDFGRANPGALTYGSIARSLEFYAATFNRAAGIEAVHVPFRGSVDAVTALAGGEFDYYFDSLAIFEPFVAQGKIRVLSTTTQQRAPDRPEIPSLADAGVPDLNIWSSFGILGPKGLPDEVVATINDAVRSFSALPDAREKLLALGLGAPVHSTPAEFRDNTLQELRVRREAARFLGVALQ